MAPSRQNATFGQSYIKAVLKTLTKKPVESNLKTHRNETEPKCAPIMPMGASSIVQKYKIISSAITKWRIGNHIKLKSL